VQSYDRIVREITGRIAMTQPECEIIEEIAGQVSTWVEIGCLWGGSAILAAMANPDLRICTVDPFDKYYDDDLCVETVLENFVRFGVAHRISIVKAKSHPWPFPASVRFDAALIDGSHTVQDVKADWENVWASTDRFVLFHDYDDPPIQDFIETSVKLKPYRISKRMVAFELRN